MNTEINLTHFFCLTICSYSLTMIITGSAILHPIRKRIIESTPWLTVEGFMHPLACRICTGFWTALVVTACYYHAFNIIAFFVVYGLSCFMATQERRS